MGVLRIVGTFCSWLMVHLENETIDSIYKAFYHHGILAVKLGRGKSEMANAQNWQVKAIGRKLLSKEHATVTKMWSHEYYQLTKSGIEAIKKKLNLSEHQVPLMHVPDTVKMGAGKLPGSDADKASHVKETEIGVPDASAEFGFRGDTAVLQLLYKLSSSQ